MSSLDRISEIMTGERPKIDFPKPTAVEAGRLISEHLSLWQQQILEGVKNEAIMREGFSLVRMKREKVNRQRLSRPSLCAAYIIYGLGPGLKEKTAYQFLQFLNNSNPLGFITWFDFTYGMQSNAGGIIIAEETIAKGESMLAGESISIMNDMQASMDRPLDLTEQAEAFLSLRQQDKTLGGLLQKDPTGLLLIDKYPTLLLSIDSGIMKYLVPGFVEAGAKFSSAFIK
jgi:hypothetical protein